VQAGSEVEVRATHGWLIGFFQWILWLFRRGGVLETTPTDHTNHKDSADETISAPDPVNGSTGVTKTSPKSEDVLKSSHSNTAGEPPRGSERADPTGEIRSKDEPKASDGWRVLNDGAVQKKHVQAFLERLPEIQAQLLEAQTAVQRALTEFMRKLMPIRMELRRPLMELKADYEYMDEIGVHRASERPKHRWLVALSLLPVMLGRLG